MEEASRGENGDGNEEETEIGARAIEDQNNRGMESGDGGAEREGNAALQRGHAQKRAYFGHELESMEFDGIRIGTRDRANRCA